MIYAAPRDDPKKLKLAVFDLATIVPLAQPVTLAQLKASPAFADSPLVKIGQLSVVPLTAAQWRALLALAKTKR